MSKIDTKDITKKILKELKTTGKAIKKHEDGCTLENPVDIDIVRTLKAEFYHKVLTIVKQAKRGE